MTTDGRPPARAFKVENSLGRSVTYFSGVSLSEAVEAAERSAAELPPPTSAQAAALITCLEHTLEGAARVSLDLAQRMYARSSDLIGVAKASGLERLSEAAFRLCDTLDEIDAQGGIEAGPVKAALEEFRRLRAAEEASALAKAAEWSLAHVAAGEPAD